MPSLNPKKLHVHFKGGVTQTAPLIPRCYTLTHSDFTGDLFLTIAADFDREALSNWQTRLMRDEVLGEWRDNPEDGPTLQLSCHVSGNGFNFGTAGWRYRIFKYHMPMVLQALRYGDLLLYEAHPEVDSAPILVRFRARQKRYNRVEHWGVPADYKY
jgi:hypothetical protein